MFTGLRRRAPVDRRGHGRLLPGRRSHPVELRVPAPDTQAQDQPPAADQVERAVAFGGAGFDVATPEVRTRAPQPWSAQRSSGHTPASPPRPLAARAADRENSVNRSISAGAGSVFDHRYSDSVPTAA